MSLPPLGQIGEDDHGTVCSYLAGLVKEARVDRSDWETLVDANIHIFTYGKETTPQTDDIIVPEIQDAVITATDIQTKEPPKVTLAPVETGEPPVVYWAGPQEIGIALGLEPFHVAEWLDDQGQLQNPLPITGDLAEQLLEAASLGQFKDTWAVAVNDKTTAELYQTLFDTYWRRSEMDPKLRTNLLNTNIQGWTYYLYEFDDDEQKFIFREVSIRQVYEDPTQQNQADAAYSLMDLAADVEEGKKLYPELAEEIEKEASTGQPTLPDQGSWGQNFQRQFERRMVPMRLAWLRNQPMPLSPDEAEALGRVERRIVPVTAPATADATGEAMTLEVVEEFREAYFLPGTDEEITPTVQDEGGKPGIDPRWPIRRGIRQLITICNYVVDDRECPFWDIPLLRNVNIPIPGKPWGMGEPFRLKGLQEARNRMLTNLVKHTDYYAAPVSVMSESMAKNLEQAYGSAYVEPGHTIIAPDDLFNLNNGKLNIFYDPPQTPPALVEMQAVLKDEIASSSGRTDVMRGVAPKGDPSGKLVENLMAGGASVMGFKSQGTADMVYRLAMLCLHSLVWRLEVDDVLRVVSKYPRHILAALHERARAIEWNVNVIVSSGNGVVENQKKLEARNDFATGAISLETLHEKLGVDHRQEKNRLRAQGMEMAQAGAGGDEGEDQGKTANSSKGKSGS